VILRDNLYINSVGEHQCGRCLNRKYFCDFLVDELMRLTCISDHNFPGHRNANNPLTRDFPERATESKSDCATWAAGRWQSAPHDGKERDI
jgi:hypothetical protein